MTAKQPTDPRHETPPDMAMMRLRNPMNAGTDLTIWTDAYYQELYAYCADQIAEAEEKQRRLDEEVPALEIKRDALFKAMDATIYDDDSGAFDAAYMKYMMLRPRMEIVDELRKRTADRLRKLNRAQTQIRPYLNYQANKAAREAAEAARKAEKDAQEAREQQERERVWLARMSPAERAQHVAREERWQRDLEHQRQRDAKRAAREAEAARLKAEAEAWANDPIPEGEKSNGTKRPGRK